jgi:hypothetical protein
LYLLPASHLPATNIHIVLAPVLLVGLQVWVTMFLPHAPGSPLLLPACLLLNVFNDRSNPKFVHFPLSSSCLSWYYFSNNHVVIYGTTDRQKSRDERRETGAKERKRQSTTAKSRFLRRLRNPVFLFASLPSFTYRQTARFIRFEIQGRTKSSPVSVALHLYPRQRPLPSFTRGSK